MDTIKQWEQRFGYDSIGRLSEAREHRGDTNALSYKQKFDYDRFGNLYRKNASNPTTGQATPIAFAPIEDADISKTNNRFTSGTTYDDAGNVTQDTKYRNQNFSYDANGRMYRTTDISQPNQSNAVYDSAGQRVATQVDGVWTFFIFDAFEKKVAEYGGLQATDEGGVKYVMQDYQGSTRAIVSNSGFVNARMDYTAFGEEIQTNIGQRTAQGYGASNTLNQKYALTERDKATGLDHTWFRKLENQAGRWTSPDPYNGSASTGDPQSWNRYSYVENEPTNFVDPSGLLRIWQCNRIWVGSGSNRVYTDWECTLVYDDGGGWNSGGGGYWNGGGGVDIQKEVNKRLDSGNCRQKLNALLKTLGKGKLKDKKSGKTGFDAVVEKFFGENRVIEQIGGLSNYDSGTGKITMNVDPTRGQGITLLSQLLGTEFIHEALHGAKGGAGFSHGDIVKAIAKVEGINFDKLTQGQKALKGKNANDSSLYEAPMNAWINKYCGEDRGIWDKDYYQKYK